MVNRDHLKRGALRAYELGRLRAAAKAVWLLLPLAIVCAAETGRTDRCACVGVLLLGTSLFLRWRNRQGADSVRAGLVAGALPLLVGLLIARIAPGCAGAAFVSRCTATCFVAGLVSGVWLGRRLARATTPTSTWLAASGIAVLAANLGCAGLGLSAAIGATLGLVLGTTSSGVTARRAS